MVNLLFTFPEICSEDFLPSINPVEAKNKNLLSGEYANKQAKHWESGLANRVQDKSLIKSIRDNIDFTIYTPCSSAGVSASILDSFSAPKVKCLKDRDLFFDRIQSTVYSLLESLGIKADLLQNSENILPLNIIAYA